MALDLQLSLYCRLCYNCLRTTSAKLAGAHYFVVSSFIWEGTNSCHDLILNSDIGTINIEHANITLKNIFLVFKLHYVQYSVCLNSVAILYALLKYYVLIYIYLTFCDLILLTILVMLLLYFKKSLNLLASNIPINQ